MSNNNNDGAHRWNFFSSGGFDQVTLETGADILALPELDQKLWTALGCPTRGVEMDPRTLDYIDADKDGRVRVPDVLAAVKWAGEMLRNPDDLVPGSPNLPLSAINDAHPEGAALLASARQILRNLGKDGEEQITADDTADLTKIFAGTRFNGDGVICVASTDQAGTGQVIQEVLDCLGADTDRSGEPGITTEKADQFFAEARSFSDWWAHAEADAANILPLGDQTLSAAATFNEVKAKVDDFFTRCRLAEYDARAADHLRPAESSYDQLATKTLSSNAAEVAEFPVASIEVNGALPLKKGVNPAWAGAIARLDREIVSVLFGQKDSLTEAEWSDISTRFTAYQAWAADKPATAVEKLGLDRLRAILASNAEQAVKALIAQDKALEPEANGILAVDKLIHLRRDLYQFLNNFVAFKNFYTRQGKAIFQAGTLYIDGRSCDLCVPVADPGKHGALATLSGTYLLYCECTRPATGEKMTIAAAMTDGDSDNLMVGRNGVFYDRKGNDWDATVVKITEHPISIRQAFWAPYKRVARMINQQVEKMASAREKAVEEKSAAGVAAAGEKAEGKGAPPAPFDVGKFAGIFAAIGLAVGAIGTALASVVGGLMALPWWQIPLAIAGLMLLISGPSMVIAWLKLRQRNLGPILDANGWAVNTRAKLNIPFGKSLTSMALLPAGSRRALTDPFAEKKSPWKTYLFLIILVAAAVLLWQNGILQGWLGMAPAKP